MSAARRRGCVEHVTGKLGVSQRLACRLLGQHRSVQRRAPMATDDEALKAFQVLSETEGIIPALESSHAIAHLFKLAPELSPAQTIIVNLSGRGDKDVNQVQEMLEDK